MRARAVVSGLLLMLFSAALPLAAQAGKRPAAKAGKRCILELERAVG